LLCLFKICLSIRKIQFLRHFLYTTPHSIFSSYLMRWAHRKRGQLNE
jgi:hypothetical protein